MAPLQLARIFHHGCGMAASVITITLKATTDGLSMSDPIGDSYTAKFDGNAVNHMAVSADGKTMKFAITDKLHNTTANWTAEKQ